MHGRAGLSTGLCLLGLVLAGCRTVAPQAAATESAHLASAHASQTQTAPTQAPPAGRYVTDVTTAAWELPGTNCKSVGVPVGWSNPYCHPTLRNAGGDFG